MIEPGSGAGDKIISFGFDRVDKDTGETPEATPEKMTPEELEKLIIESNRMVAQAVESIKTVIFKMFKEQNQKLDPAGIRLLGYDSKKVSVASVAKVLDVQPAIQSVTHEDLASEPAFDFEIEILPFEQIQRTITSYFDQDEGTEVMGSGNENHPMRFQFHDKTGTKVTGSFFPIGVAATEWIQLESEPKGIYAYAGMDQPKLTSIVPIDQADSSARAYEKKVDKVKMSGVDRNEVDLLYRLAEAEMKKMAEIAEKILSGEYHFRIFGQKDSRHPDAQKPVVIFATPKLSDGN